jgi:hypothetical protein
MQQPLFDWFASLHRRPGGDILAVQTLRNAIMAASVLASAALVGLMGVLATAHLHPRWSSASAATLLVVSAMFSLRALWTLSAAGFDLRLTSPTGTDSGTDTSSVANADNPVDAGSLVGDIALALRCIRWSGMLLVLALTAAGAGVWVAV